MLGKLSKSNVSFMMTIIDTPHHIFSYRYPFEVFFAQLEILLKKLQFICTPQKPKSASILDKNQLQSRSLDNEKYCKCHIGQNNLMNPFLPLYIEETNKPYMHQKIKWAQRQARSPSVNIFIFPFEFSNSGCLDILRLCFKSQPSFYHSKSCRGDCGG